MLSLQVDIQQTSSLLKLTTYSINSNADYVPPPAIDVLGNSTYNITPAVSRHHRAAYTLILPSNYLYLSMLDLEQKAS